MDYKKPQSTLVQGGAGIYPLTTADQVILADGSRLEKDGHVHADVLGGKTLAEIMLDLYPVGAVYISAQSTSPASLFGGTWEQIEDRFLLAAGSTYAAGSTGGNASVKLTKNNIPPLSLYYSGSGAPNRPCIGSAYIHGSSAQDGYIDAVNTQNTSPSPVNIMPPYLAVYMWKRIPDEEVA